VSAECVWELGGVDGYGCECVEWVWGEECCGCGDGGECQGGAEFGWVWEDLEGEVGGWWFWMYIVFFASERLVGGFFWFDL
jgi:hypothetical protein